MNTSNARYMAAGFLLALLLVYLHFTGTNTNPRPRKGRTMGQRGANVLKLDVA